MHEMSLVKNLISVLEPQVADPEVGHVKKINLEAGELRYIVPEIMNTCFSYMDKPDKLQGAQISVAVVPGNSFVVKNIEW